MMGMINFYLSALDVLLGFPSVVVWQIGMGVWYYYVLFRAGGIWTIRYVPESKPSSLPTATWSMAKHRELFI